MAAPGSTAPHVVAIVDGTTAGPHAGSKAHSEMLEMLVFEAHGRINTLKERVVALELQVQQLQTVEQQVQSLQQDVARILYILEPE
jgi:hypothetical protein